MNLATETRIFGATLETEAAGYGVMLSKEAVAGLSRYFRLLNLWNPRVHLVAPCSPQEFATRHVLEALVLLKHLPSGGSVADVGSGGGLPIMPCLIVRPDLDAVLIDSSQKKVVFLREALAQAGMSARATVIGERFENVAAPEVDFVTCRALERFEEVLPHLFQWAPRKATMLLFGAKRLETRIESLGLTSTAALLPHSQGRFLFVVKQP